MSNCNIFGICHELDQYYHGQNIKLPCRSCRRKTPTPEQPYKNGDVIWVNADGKKIPLLILQCLFSQKTNDWICTFCDARGDKPVELKNKYYDSFALLQKMII